MDKTLEGLTVLVTGSSVGIGAAIVERLAADGAHPIIHYGRDKAGAEAVLARIGGAGLILQADLSIAEGPFELWHKGGRGGGSDTRPCQQCRHSHRDFDRSLGRGLEIGVAEGVSDQVFFAAADLAKEAIRHFMTNGGGRIVNMASRAGQRGYAADAMPYGASKAGLVNLTKSIARSFGADGVTAVAIAPGWVRTDMAEDFVAVHGKHAAVADIPIGEMALPAVIAELVAFVMRPSQASLNGATLDVNGGSYIR
ncbi:NAD(P)-dependent dehydrogenase (short-subunit alcohol dehydrogenase family) [Mesorhizobium shonense]|uniref:NAD(P)-dependent dehydrogenase (Short-subunit alcohol dehydrogenase family) n=1 Tax=Mesorhizobium shonense TaxID=1209948 RepID=A0ABV2I6J7_9HYPH